jgi:3-methyladenine DNA glycosylase AlkC
VIDVVKAFDKQKQRLAKKDIYAYKTPGELRQALEDLGASKRSEKKRLKSQETTYLGTFGDWIVAMPHTVESSCQLGKGTTWCTAATETQNLFLSYVGRSDEDIILYYIMKKGVDSRQDVTAKLSVGFVNGKPVLEGQDGGVSVDADNEGLTPQRLKGILGNQYDPIMDAMEIHAEEIRGVHPARKQMAKIAKDPNLYQKYTKNLEGYEREDFADIILDYKSLSPEVFRIMLPDLEGRETISKLARNPNTSPEILKILASYKNRYLKRAVAKNPNTPPEAFIKLANDDDEYVRVAVAKNPSTPLEVSLELLNNLEPRIKRTIAKDPDTTTELLSALASDDDLLVREAVAANDNTPQKILVKLADDSNELVRETVAANENTPPDVLRKLASDPEENVRVISLGNPNMPPDVLRELANDEDQDVKLEIAHNPNTPIDVLKMFATDDDKYVRVGAVQNPSLPTEVSLKLLKDEKDVYVLKWIARSPNASLEILKGLASHPNEDVRRAVRSNPNYKKLNLQETNRKTKMTKDSLDKIIKEEYNTLLKERKMINYHISNKIPFSSNTFRIGSDSYFRVIKEARRLYKLGKLTPLNEMDKELFENSELGEWAIFEGERIPLDFPMYNEAKKKKDPPIGKPMKNTGGGKKYKVYVRNPKTGKIKKVTYGDSKGGLKGNWNNAEARKSFAARHKCAKKKDRTKPGYWACRAHKDFGTNVPGRFW